MRHIHNRAFRRESYYYSLSLKINWYLIIRIQDNEELLTLSYWLIYLFTTTTTHYNWRIQCWPDNNEDYEGGYDDEDIDCPVILDPQRHTVSVWWYLDWTEDLFIFRNRTGKHRLCYNADIILLIEWEDGTIDYIICLQ